MNASINAAFALSTKPLSTTNRTSVEARELAERAEQYNAWGQVGFMKRFAEINIVKTKFSQGAYPQIRGIDTPKRAFLIGQICHICDLSRYFGGEVESISADYHEVTEEQFSYMATVKYRSGAIGCFDWNTLCGYGFRDIDEELEVVGFDSRLTCRDMLTLKWQPKDSWTCATPETGRYLHTYEPAWSGVQSSRNFGYRGEVNHFALKCIGQAEGGPNLWDSYH